MILNVYVNGIVQVPGIDYVAGTNVVSFTRPPARGSDILVKGQFGDVTHITADGSTYLYRISDFADNYNYAMNLLNDALKYYDNPAVADVLERLRVVVELVKQDS